MTENYEKEQKELIENFKKQVDEAVARAESGERHQSFELDFALAKELEKIGKTTGNIDTIPLPVVLSSQRNKDILTSVFQNYKADDEMRKKYPQIAMLVKLQTGRYAGLLIKGKNVVWIDPAGASEMPKHIAEVLKNNFGTERNDVIVSHTKYQPTKRNELGLLVESDDNSALFAIFLLTSVIGGKMGLKLDESTNEMKLYYKNIEERNNA